MTTATTELVPQYPTSAVSLKSMEPTATVNDISGQINPNMFRLHKPSTAQINNATPAKDSAIEFDTRVECITDDECMREYMKTHPEYYLGTVKPYCSASGVCKVTLPGRE